MGLTETEERELIAELARSRVAEIAPQELVLFRATSEAYFKRPDEAQRRTTRGGDMLGFGVGGAVTFLTPVILAVAKEVIAFLVAEVSKQLKSESTDAISVAVKRLFKPFVAQVGGQSASTGSASAPPLLSQQQLTRIRQLAFEKAKQFSLADEQAGLLADSMVGSLVVAA